MSSLTSSFATGFAATLLLAAPRAWAQTTVLTASSARVPSSRSAGPNAAEVPTKPGRTLNAPTKAATTVYSSDAPQDLQQTLAWMQETNSLYPEYWSVYAEARIRLQLKDYAGAQTTATEAKGLALAAANADYARRSDEVLAQAKLQNK